MHDANNMRDISREQFEATVIKQFEGLGEEAPSLARNDDGDYQGLEVQAAWWGWQASREAVVVELPEQFSPHDCGEWAMWSDLVEKAIEAQGLKVAP